MSPSITPLRFPLYTNLSRDRPEIITWSNVAVDAYAGVWKDHDVNDILVDACGTTYLELKDVSYWSIEMVLDSAIDKDFPLFATDRIIKEILIIERFSL